MQGEPSDSRRCRFRPFAFVQRVRARNSPWARESLRGPSGWRCCNRKEKKMGKVIVMNGVSLDGVMQGPGRPDEDTRDGFEQGGWGIPYGDDTVVAKMGERMGGDR